MKPMCMRLSKLSTREPSAIVLRVVENTMEPKKNEDLKSLSLDDVKKKLGFTEGGLSDAEAKKRLTQYGPNEIEEKKTNPFLKFLTYFWGPIPWMIEVAVVLSGVVQH